MALVAWVMNVRPLKLVFCRNQGRAPQWSRWKLGGGKQSSSCPNSRSSRAAGPEGLRPCWTPVFMNEQTCDIRRNWQRDWLADEQQVDLSRVNQVDVRQSIHSLQTGMDPAVQLKHTTRCYTHLRWDGLRFAFFFFTIIFRPLNSRMIHDRPTSCPAPLETWSQH